MTDDIEKRVLEQKINGVLSTILILHPSNTKDKEYYSNEYTKLQKIYSNLYGKEYIPGNNGSEVKR